MTIKWRICCIITLICMAASCSRVPKHILSERKMRVVLYDMLLAEAMVDVKNESFPTNADRQMVYDAVFSKHRITQAVYDSSLIWYGKHMDLYMSIYKLVLKDVNENYNALGAINSNMLSGDMSLQDSIDIWISKRSEIFKPELTFNTVTFDISPESPYPAGSSYIFELSVWGLPPDMKQKPVIHLCAVQADTITSIRQEITGDGYNEAILKTATGKEVRRIYGYIILNDVHVPYHRIYLNDIRLMKYNNRITE